MCDTKEYNRIVPDLEFLPDGRRLISNGYHERLIRIWDVFMGEELQQFPILCALGDVAVSSKGDFLVTSGPELTLWRQADGALLWQYRGNAHNLAISPDGCTVLSGGTDALVHLWRLPRHLFNTPMPRSATTQ